MRLTKTQSRIIAVGLLLLFFLVGSIIIRTKKELGTIPTIAITKEEDGSYDTKVVFGEFKKSEVKDGKKVWEIHAVTGKYSPEKGIADLDKPVVDLYRGDDVITITADRAKITLQGTGLSHVDAMGSVVAHSRNKDATVKTEHAIYDKPTDKLFCPEHVEIIGKQGTLSGDDLEGSVDIKNFVIRKNVTTYIEPEATRVVKQNPKSKKK